MDRTEKLSKEQRTPIVAKIYDYALIDSFWGFPRLIDSPTSYATLEWGQVQSIFFEIYGSRSGEKFQAQLF